MDFPTIERPPLVIADAVRIFGGAERFVLDAARGLGERGWPVTVLAYPDAPLHARARAAGLRVRTARTRANGAPWTVLPLLAWLRRERIGVLLSVYDKDLRTAALAARLSRTGVTVVHSRECEEPIKPRPWIRWFHTRVADAVLVNSEATRTITLRSAPWLEPSRVELVPKGVDLDRYAPALAHPPGRHGEPGVVFGFVGQLVARKRVDHLLEALRGVRTPWTLRIAGTGPEEAALRLQTRAKLDPERVFFDGFVEDVPAWLARIDVLVLPSLVEGWGYAAAEAAAAGRVVLAYDASSLPEVTPREAGAVLVDPHREDGLRHALVEIAAEGAAGWQARGRSLRAHAERALGLDRMLSDLDTVLLRHLARRR